MLDAVALGELGEEAPEVVVCGVWVVGTVEEADRVGVGWDEEAVGDCDGATLVEDVADIVDGAVLGGRGGEDEAGAGRGVELAVETFRAARL